MVFIQTSLLSSRFIVKKTTCFPIKFNSTFSRNGADNLQVPHPVNQKSSNTTLPLNSEKDRILPEASGKLKLKAGAPANRVDLSPISIALNSGKVTKSSA